MQIPHTHLFGSLDIATFLTEYWQKKPLLVRQAFPNFDPIINAEQLFALACETDRARIIVEKGGKTPWELRYGPFNKRNFSRLPKTHWTLLVNDTEKLIPALYKVIEPFRFLPDWRIDDLMISFATDGGSVGPHYDEYDVFLLQGYGKRHWQISEKRIDSAELIPNIDLRILKHFIPEQEWILEPGDMLYLPPHIAHYGRAQGDCMTYSIGFRSPNAAELGEEWLQHVLSQNGSYTRYTDTQRLPQLHKGEINVHDLAALYQCLTHRLTHTAEVYEWLGCFLSKSNVDIEPEEMDYSIIQPLSSEVVCKSVGVRFLYFKVADHINFFANGQHFKVASSSLPLIQTLCSSLPEQSITLAPHLNPAISPVAIQPAQPAILTDLQLIQALLKLNHLHE